IIDFSGVEQFVDTPVKHYSSGMYVRLAFAVAAHLRSEILLVDEVLAVGDVEFQRKCLGKMKNVARDGRTVLMVSHDVRAISRLCRRALVLSHGRLAFDGPVESAIDAYLQDAHVTPSSVASDSRRSGTGEYRFSHVTSGKGSYLPEEPKTFQ